MAVVAAAEFDNDLAASVSAGKTQGAHRRLRPAVDKTYLLNAGHHGDDLLGKLRLDAGGGTVARAKLKLLLEAFDDSRVRVANDERPPRKHIVDIAVAVNVPEVRPSRPLNEQRRAAYAAKRADRRIDAARQHLLGRIEEFL